MSRKKFQLKNPTKISFSLPLEVANLFRSHCAINGFMIGPVLEEAVINYLKEEGYEERLKTILADQEPEEEEKPSILVK